DLAGAKVEDAADTVLASRRNERAIDLEGDGQNFGGVTLLCEKFGRRLNVPQAPSVVVASGADVLARRVKFEVCDTRFVAFERGERSGLVDGPEMDGTFAIAGR